MGGFVEDCLWIWNWFGICMDTCLLGRHSSHRHQHQSRIEKFIIMHELNIQHYHHCSKCQYFILIMYTKQPQFINIWVANQYCCENLDLFLGFSFLFSWISTTPWAFLLILSELSLQGWSCSVSMLPLPVHVTLSLRIVCAFLFAEFGIFSYYCLANETYPRRRQNIHFSSRIKNLYFYSIFYRK